MNCLVGCFVNYKTRMDCLFFFFSQTRRDVTLEDFQKIFVFSVTSELIKGLHPDARSLLQLSIPVNKPVISLTTVVQKQTVLGLHMYKMHILFFFISYVFDLFHHCYKNSKFFSGTFALTCCLWHVHYKVLFWKKKPQCVFLCFYCLL